ncbi:MAG: type II toxin-antitoxin system RelE/ParE family toxin [Phycisphaerae bacterium]
MLDEVDKHGRIIAATGRYHYVVLAKTGSGKSPVAGFLDRLRKEEPRVFALFVRAFNTVCDFPKPECYGFQWLKHERGDLYAFRDVKSQYRISCYVDGRSIVLLDGFKKRKKKWREDDFRRAEAMMAEDRSRKRSLK